MPEDEAPAAGDQAGEGAGSVPVDEETPVEEMKGDIITFTSGKVMHNVQIIRETPRHYIVEVLKGIEPLEIERRTVKSVVYDDVDPLKRDRLEALNPPESSTTIALNELSPELLEKLQRPVTPQPVNHQQQDFIPVLQELAQRQQLPLIFHESVTSVPPQQRLWTVSLTPDMTFIGLFELLEEGLTGIKVDYRFDKVLILTREAAAQEPPALQPAPGEVPSEQPAANILSNPNPLNRPNPAQPPASP